MQAPSRSYDLSSPSFLFSSSLSIIFLFISFVSLPVFSSCLGLVNLSQVHDLEWLWYGHMQVGYHYGHHHLCSGHEFPPGRISYYIISLFIGEVINGP